jgi:NADH-quinone oxidoreductase subunit J
MVLFLFVIMLLNIADEDRFREVKSVKRLLAIVVSGGVAAEIIASIVVVEGTGAQAVSQEMNSLGTVEGIGKALFTTYVFPFEVTSLLLLAAMVGVIILAKKKFS